MEELDLVFEPFPGESLGRFLFENIANFNVAATGVASWHPVGFFLEQLHSLLPGTGFVQDIVQVDPEFDTQPFLHTRQL